MSKRGILAGVGIMAAAGAVALGANLPACEVEDGSGQAICLWSAERAGNGSGSSVVNLASGSVWFVI